MVVVRRPCTPPVLLYVFPWRLTWPTNRLFVHHQWSASLGLWGESIGDWWVHPQGSKRRPLEIDTGVNERVAVCPGYLEGSVMRKAFPCYDVIMCVFQPDSSGARYLKLCMNGKSTPASSFDPKIPGTSTTSRSSMEMRKSKMAARGQSIIFRTFLQTPGLILGLRPAN